MWWKRNKNNNSDMPGIETNYKSVGHNQRTYSISRERDRRYGLFNSNKGNDEVRSSETDENNRNSQPSNNLGISVGEHYRNKDFNENQKEKSPPRPPIVDGTVPPIFDEIIAPAPTNQKKIGQTNRRILRAKIESDSEVFNKELEKQEQSRKRKYFFHRLTYLVLILTFGNFLYAYFNNKYFNSWSDKWVKLEKSIHNRDIQATKEFVYLFSKHEFYNDGRLKRPQDFVVAATLSQKQYLEQTHNFPKYSSNLRAFATYELVKYPKFYVTYGTDCRSLYTYAFMSELPILETGDRVSPISMKYQINPANINFYSPKQQINNQFRSLPLLYRVYKNKFMGLFSIGKKSYVLPGSIIFSTNPAQKLPFLKPGSFEYNLADKLCKK